MEAEAARLVADGTTTREEVLRVVQPYVDARAPCRRCLSAVPAGAVGCPHCGAVLMKVCGCGVELEPDWRYCPSCIRPTVSSEDRCRALSGAGDES